VVRRLSGFHFEWLRKLVKYGYEVPGMASMKRCYAVGQVASVCVWLTSLVCTGPGLVMKEGEAEGVRRKECEAAKD
jgi:hypothetical protein